MRHENNYSNCIKHRALLAGIALAVTLGSPFPVFTKKVSKYLLQASVVGLGFGMNLYSAVESGKDGMLFTIVSVVGVMVIGTLLGRVFKLSRNNSYLISSGTAICGGSAIAAVAPVIDADDNETTLSMVPLPYMIPARWWEPAPHTGRRR